MNENNEILHLEAEEMSLQTEINDALVKANVTDKVIATLRENYLPLKLESLNDREGYEKIKEARKDCKNLRVMASKICKAGREDYNKKAQQWIDKENEVCGEIKKVETYLSEQEASYDAERERERKEKIERENKQWLSRSLALIQLGAVMIGDYLVLQDVSFENLLIKECDNETFEQIILPPYKAIYDDLEAERNRKFIEEQKQKEEFQQQQTQLRQQQALFRQQEEQRKQEVSNLQRQVEVNNASDIEKWKHIYEHLTRTPSYVMQSAQYKTKMKAVREFLNSIGIQK